MKAFLLVELPEFRQQYQLGLMRSMIRRFSLITSTRTWAPAALVCPVAEGWHYILGSFVKIKCHQGFFPQKERQDSREWWDAVFVQTPLLLETNCTRILYFHFPGNTMGNAFFFSMWQWKNTSPYRVCPSPCPYLLYPIRDGKPKNLPWICSQNLVVVYECVYISSDKNEAMHPLNVMEFNLLYSLFFMQKDIQKMARK